VSDRVLVTGGAGYVGSVVVERLLAEGYGVVVLDNLSTGHRGAVAAGATLIEGEVGDPGTVERLLAAHRPVAVMHLAACALVAESVANPGKYYANNVEASRALLSAATAAGVRRFVFSSSCSVYGVPARLPITEDTPTAPLSPYGETKLAFERDLQAAASKNGFAAVSLRYFNAAGATERLGEDHAVETHLIPNVLRVALGRAPRVEIYGTDYPTPDGTAVRDYVHVSDIADAHLLALKTPARGAVALNLGSGSGYSVREVVDAARAVTHLPIPAVEAGRRPGDPPVLVAGAARAREVLGWTPRTPALSDIVASAWRWHQAHPDGYAT
jgi:UDP-glucose 4-epimerase